jgi:hypothetical protein
MCYGCYEECGKPEIVNRKHELLQGCATHYRPVIRNMLAGPLFGYCRE